MKREARQEFYRRMHAAGREIYEAGQEAERDRIIKLITEHFCINNDSYGQGIECGCRNFDGSTLEDWDNHLMALIKEENK